MIGSSDGRRETARTFPRTDRTFRRPSVWQCHTYFPHKKIQLSGEIISLPLRFEESSSQMKIMFLLWLSSSHWLASGGTKCRHTQRTAANRQTLSSSLTSEFLCFSFPLSLFSSGSSAFEGVKKLGAMWWAGCCGGLVTSPLVAPVVRSPTGHPTLPRLKKWPHNFLPKCPCPHVCFYKS